MKYAVGLMSGTSLDGVDVALVAFDKETYQLVDFQNYPFTMDMKRKISQSLDKETSNVELICSVNYSPLS